MLARGLRPWALIAPLLVAPPATLALVDATAHAQATAPASAAGTACGRQLSPPVLEKWASMGGEKGPLGCPAADEAATVTSRAGTAAREADFSMAAIVWHASGPRAGQTYAVSGCIYRLFFQYGGAGGWLGLPLGDAVNTPDGQNQAFEGARATFERATDECDAEPNADLPVASAPAAPAPAVGASPLDLFWDPARGDHISAASAGTVWTAFGAHYQRLRNQAQVLTDQAAGTAPLKLFWNEAAGDHVTVATIEGERDALANGYRFEASQGFVWPDPHPGATPLKQYRNETTGHHLLAATPQDEADATAQGFTFVRIEGYAPGGAVSARQ